MTKSQNVRMLLVPQEKVSDILDRIPHKKIADLTAVYTDTDHIEDGIGKDDFITNADLQKMGLNENDLAVNAAQNNPAALIPVPGGFSQIEAMYGKRIRKTDIDTELFIVSTVGTVFGAAVIAYPGFMDTVLKQLGSELVLFPYSVNQFLVIKRNGNVDYRRFMDAVQQLKKGVITPDLDLTGNVYRYGKDGFGILPEKGKDSIGKKFAFAAPTIQETFS